MIVKHHRLSFALAVLVALGLGYDAWVHLDLASNFDSVGDTITQGNLFRLEAGLAIVAAILVLATDHRLAWAAAGLTGLAGVAAVLLYRYVDVGDIGPIPNMYEPIWYDDKTNSALAEGGVALVWLVRETLRFISASAAGSPAPHEPALPQS